MLNQDIIVNKKTPVKIKYLLVFILKFYNLKLIFYSINKKKKFLFYSIIINNNLIYKYRINKVNNINNGITYYTKKNNKTKKKI
jgi:hypothetical protein